MTGSALDGPRWRRLCRRLDCGAAEVRFDEIARAHAEAHRHYHTGQHVTECLALFDELAGEGDHADEVELAIWLHDVVYRPRRDDNEERSADVAAEWLTACAADPPVVRRVRDLILITRHAQEPATADERLLVDIDLHILGAARARFDEYERQVRAEYRWVPGPLFRRRRRQILGQFLDRDPLYRTEPCRERFEAQARLNLAHAVARLGG